MLYSNSSHIGVKVCEFQFSASDNPFPSGGTDPKKWIASCAHLGSSHQRQTCNSLKNVLNEYISLFHY